MPADYSNPPLIEALCEFQFEPGQTWDWTIPGLVYARVQEQFPVRQEQQTIQFGVAPGQAVSPPTANVSRVQFLRQDRSALIQIGPNFLGVNHLRPYPNWEAFSEVIFRNLDVYTEIAQPRSVARIGLRYINKLEVPTSATEENLNVALYLRALPGVPRALLNNPMLRFIQRVEIENVDARGLLVLQTGSLPPGVEGVNAFLLDLDFVTALDATLPLDEARQWIIRAHEEIELAFEACVTDQARILFGDKQHG